MRKWTDRDAPTRVALPGMIAPWIALALPVTLALPLVLVFALSAPPLAHAAAYPTTTVPLGSLLASQTAGIPTIGQVERIALGSRGATVTLDGGEEMVLDFSGLAGVGGGPNYVGWAMVLFGLSVATRLLASVSRILRPFRRRRSHYDDE